MHVEICDISCVLVKTVKTQKQIKYQKKKKSTEAIIFKIYHFNLCNSLLLPASQLNKSLKSLIPAYKMLTKKNPPMWLGHRKVNL